MLGHLFQIWYYTRHNRTLQVYSSLNDLIFTQCHRVMRKLELVQLFCCEVAWSKSCAEDGWLCKYDEYGSFEHLLFLSCFCINTDVSTHITNLQQKANLVEQGNSCSVDWEAGSWEVVTKRKVQATPWSDIKAQMEEKTEVFKWVASEANNSGKAPNRDRHSLTSGNSTDRWRAALQTPPPLTS